MTRAGPGTGSIRGRLMVLLLGGSAILALALFWVVQGFARQLAEESQDNILSASVTSILDAARIENGALVLDLPYSAFSMLANLHDDAVYYAIRADDTFLTGYDDLAAVPLPRADMPGFATRSFLDQDVRVVTAERALGPGGGQDSAPIRLSATLAQTRSGQEITLTRISRAAAAVGLGVFAGAAVLALAASRSAIAPLERLTLSVTRRGPQDLRPVTAPVPLEMVPLVAALNRFIGRLRGSLARSEDFIAEAAHRVRTPLATVRMQAEVTLQRVEREENRKSVREMIRAIDESSRAAGQLLDHAMVTFRADQLEETDLDLGAVTRDLTDRLRPTADLRDIALQARADDPVPIRGDAILVQNALRNVLDNAIKYAPEGSAVRITVTRQGEEGVVMLRDTGPGFPPDGMTRLRRRFQRGANVDGIVGSGLGLTIADEVMRAHGGTLDLRNNPDGGGACVSLRFPMA
ncbi:MAG: sensor histidine kinase [Marinibacterium sp.]|nr:sensor histidine kinase [Marinibacterium sp.]